MTTEMPAGTYYIGDLCYVMHDRWDEVCALIIEGNDVHDGVYTLADGTQFGILGTAHGDGQYADQRSRYYAVDSGTIGCVLIDRIDTEQKASTEKGGLAAIETIPYPFTPQAANGFLTFGPVVINTND